MEYIPDRSTDKVHTMITQKVLDDVRQKLIKSFQKAIKIYTHGETREWINESNCRELIEKLRAKQPIQIVGSFWRDNLNEIIYEYGYPDYGETRGEHFEIQKRIEKGE